MKPLAELRLFFHDRFQKSRASWGTVVLAGLILGVAGALMSRFTMTAIPVQVPVFLPYVFQVVYSVMASLLLWGVGTALLSIAGSPVRPSMIWAESFRIVIFWGLVTVPIAAFFAPRVGITAGTGMTGPASVSVMSDIARAASNSLASNIITWGRYAVFVLQLGFAYVGLREAGSKRAEIAAIVFLLVAVAFVVSSRLLALSLTQAMSVQ